MPKPIYIVGSLGFALLACSALAQPNQEIVSTLAECPAPTPAATNATPNPLCPEGMAHVSGEYCPTVKQECLVWKDVPCEFNQGKDCRPMAYARCQTFKPSVCLSEKVHKDF